MSDCRRCGACCRMGPCLFNRTARIALLRAGVISTHRIRRHAGTPAGLFFIRRRSGAPCEFYSEVPAPEPSDDPGVAVGALATCALIHIPEFRKSVIDGRCDGPAQNGKKKNTKPRPSPKE